jgi:hypothetical protein
MQVHVDLKRIRISEDIVDGHVKDVLAMISRSPSSYPLSLLVAPSFADFTVVSSNSLLMLFPS